MFLLVLNVRGCHDSHSHEGDAAGGDASRVGRRAVGDPALVLVAHETHVPLLAPRGAPRVLDLPVRERVPEDSGRADVSNSLSWEAKNRLSNTIYILDIKGLEFRIVLTNLKQRSRLDAVSRLDAHRENREHSFQAYKVYF